MTGSIKTKTPKYKFIIPQFNIATWHDYIEDNFRAIDALFFNIFDIQNFSGSWTKTTEYKKDQVLFIPEDYEVDETGQLKKDEQGELIQSEFSGRLVKVLKDHTTDNSDYFSLYYFNHKDEYELFADASTAQKFANLAKQYSENAQQSENNAELYKNNAQGYAQEAENSKNIAQQNAQLATNKAESAASSATIAKNSENSAANSATLAKEYKNNAKSFADSAKNSENVTVENVQIVNDLVQDPNLVAVGTDLRSASSNIKNVSSISEQTKNVSDNMSYIKSVDNNKVNINKAVTNEANITTVAENINNVNITAQNKDNIDTVVNYKDAITNTSTNINAVNNVSENMADVKEAVQSANDAKLWAIGTITEKPEGSSKYWAEQAKQTAQVYDATETVKGIVRLATSDEVTAGTNDSAAITPLKLKSKLDTKQDKSTAVNYNNISNCITYIPQDIKLELNNGTLTLKAGSKVYVPNGFEADGTTPKFDVVTINSNITQQNILNGINFIRYQNGRLFVDWNVTTFSSGADPAGVTGWFYDTTTNYIGYYENGTRTNQISFPIGIVTVSGGVITSIDQVFNGFGYIGSTVFALPGVKGLIPNGRNADGSLKNIGFETKMVLTVNADTAYSNRNIGISSSSVELLTTAEYSFVDNLVKNSSGVNTVKCIAGKFSADSTSRITSFTPKTVFHALDYNDKSTISGWSMPSSRYIDLTLGASGSTYTAPANGWFFLWRICNGSDSFAGIYSSFTSIFSGDANEEFAIFIPVKKGDIIACYYNNLKTNQVNDTFRFIYAEGEK